MMSPRTIRPSHGLLKKWFARTRTTTTENCRIVTTKESASNDETTNTGYAFSAFIAEQLAAEQARRAGIEARGVNVVTTSGTFIGAVFAIAAFALGNEYAVSQFGLAAIWTTLGLFVVASISAVAASLPFGYGVADTASLRAMTGVHWTDTEDAAKRELARNNVETIATLRKANKKKARAIILALAAQIGAMLILAAGVSIELVIKS
jgi:hypothetical protein